MSDDALSGAVLAYQDRLRLDLWRGPPGPYALYIGLNPSTADASEDDATIRVLRRFTRERFGLERFHIVNLSPLRAAKPKDMVQLHKNAQRSSDAADMDRLNQICIMSHIALATKVVACWGSVPKCLAGEPARVAQIARDRQKTIYRMGPALKSGQPHHPLYLSRDVGIEVHQ